MRKQRRSQKKTAAPAFAKKSQSAGDRVEIEVAEKKIPGQSVRFSSEGDGTITCTSISGRTYEGSLRDRLVKVIEVEAVYVNSDEQGTVHVYSVVQEYGQFYKRLMRQEQLIEQDCPEVSFDFHVRARQNRLPYLSVPFDAKPIFIRVLP